MLWTANKENDRSGEMASLQRSIARLSVAHGHRDPYTVSHQLRTATLACQMATRMGLDEERVEIVRLAASVHDIGKNAVPVEILFRAEPLTGAEMEVVKRHSSIGQDILRRLESSYLVADIVAQHHERLDGSGYPCGLKGRDILPEAQILAAADVFDAMTSKRPYRDGLSAEIALAELRNNAGRLFDPDAVDACHACVAQAEARSKASPVDGGIAAP